MTEPLDCDHALLLVAATTDLRVTDRQLLHAHLETCPGCRHTFEALAEPDAEDLLDLPTVPADAYRRDAERRQGGMGTVVGAFDRRLGRRVAIKEPIGEAGYARFVREARLTARVEHPSIVTVHEAGRWDDGRPFYAMQLVDGRSLAEELAARATFAERLAMLPQVIAVADAIAHAHDRRVIHRDLKPANIMIGRHGEAVVIDWGLSTQLASADPEPPLPAAFHTAEQAWTAVGVGTPQYMSPEQMLGEQPDERWDVYALGATLYHVLTGEPPYGARGGVALIEDILRGPPRALGALEPWVPAELLTIVERAMARDPRDRYANAVAVADELRAFQAGRLVAAHRYSAFDRARRWIRRHRAVAAVSAVSLAVVVALGGWSARRIVAEQRRAEDSALILVEDEARAKRQQAAAREFICERLEKYLELSRLAGEVATAASVDEARRVVEQMRSARFHDGDHPALETAIKQLDEALPATWFGSGVMPDPDVLGARALAVPRAVRSSWGQITAAVSRMADRSLEPLIAEVERENIARPLLYRAVAAARALRDPEPARSAAVRCFWQLYWGEMYFIETERLHGKAVESAMVGIGRRLRAHKPLDRAVAELEQAALDRAIAELEQAALDMAPTNRRVEIVDDFDRTSCPTAETRPRCP